MTEQLTHTRREKRASKRHKEGWELGWLLAEEEPLFPGGTVSPYIRTFKLQTFKDANVHLHVQWCQAWVKLHLALHLLLLMILQLYHLPPPLPSPVSNSSCLFTRCQPLYASCCTILRYFSRYCTVRIKKCFIFVFVFYVLLVWKVL